MEELSVIRYTERGSRFFAHLYEIENTDDMIELLKVHRTRYRKAVHHCYAVRRRSAGKLEESYRNDGEVGHPGQVLLEVLRRSELESHCLMVSRIFGGVKLGVGGVSRAFREAGEAAVGDLDSDRS